MTKHTATARMGLKVLKSEQSEPRSGLKVMGAQHQTPALGVKGWARPTGLAPEGRTRGPGAG